MAVSIRELGLRDQIMVTELLDVCLPGWSDALAPAASGPLAFLADSMTFALGGYVDNEPAGLAWGAHVRRPHGDYMTYVHELDVVAAYRRQGVATLLIEAALGLARQRGSSELWLVTRASNEASIALYEQLGAERTWQDGATRFVWGL